MGRREGERRKKRYKWLQLPVLGQAKMKCLNFHLSLLPERQEPKFHDLDKKWNKQDSDLYSYGMLVLQPTA